MQSIDFSTHGREINSVYNKIVTGDESVAWAVFSPDSSNSYKPSEQGDGDIEEFVGNFNEGRVEFGLIRVYPPGSDVKKLLLIGWCPDSVSIKARSSFASNFATVAKTLRGYHVQVTARDEDDLDPQDLLKRVSDAAGARYSIQHNAPRNFGTEPAASRPIAPKPAPSKSFSPSKPVSSTSTGSSSISRTNQFIPKPIAPKPVAPAPKSPFFGSKTSAGKPAADKQDDDDGWNGAEAVEVRDLTKKPLENVKPAWKPIGKVDVDAIRSGAKSEAPKPKPAPAPAPSPAPKKEEKAHQLPKESKFDNDNDEDLDEDEKAFREKRKLFNAPHPVETITPKPKPIVSSNFKPVASPAARPGLKVPLPRGFDNSKDRLEKGADKNYGAENGKTPAQIWAEKHGKYDSSASPAPPVKSSSAEPEEQPEAEEEPSVSELADKFKKADLEAEQEEQEEKSKPVAPPSLPSANRPIPNAPTSATRAVPPPPAESGSATPAPLPPRNLPARPEPEQEQEEEPEPEQEEEQEPEEEKPAPAQAAAASASEANKSVTAIAQFDYTKQDDDEISLHEEELITEIVFEDEDWWRGKNSRGNFGQFPANYVELTGNGDAASPNASESKPKDDADVDENGYPIHTGKSGTAQYDYSAEEDNELSFSEGDVITDIYEADEDWWLGTLNGKRKLVPSNYITLNE